MGNVWGFYAGESAAFDAAACSASSCTAFYASFRATVAAVETSQQLEHTESGAADARVRIVETLSQWPREAAILYEQLDEAPLTVPMPRELEHESMEAEIQSNRSSGQQSEISRSPVTLEENVLHGLCANPLSTSDAIYQVLLQLGKRLPSDEFLRVVGSHPRASKLFASQQLQAASDVHRSFRMALLEQNHRRAATIVGKAAYGEGAVESKRRRLQETSKLLQRSLDASTPSLASALAQTAEELQQTSVRRACDSFNQAMTQEALALLETQQAMEHTLGLPSGVLVGGSLMETIQKLLALQPTHAQALRLTVDLAEQHGVPPRQFWWTLLRVCARTERWELLLALSAKDRPVIGYVAIAEVLLDEDRVALARRLLAGIRDADEHRQVADMARKYEAEQAG